MIKRFLDTILPGDVELQLPPAGTLGIDLKLTDLTLQEVTGPFFELLTDVAGEKYDSRLVDLNDEQYLKVVASAQRKNIRLVTHYVNLCLSYYYSHPDVLNQVNAGAVPPFPDGNTLPSDDWELLEAVYNRGPIYKDLP